MKRIKNRELQRRVCAVIRDMRKSFNYSQEVFGEKVGLTQCNYSNKERCDTDLSIDELKTMAKALNLSAAELLQLAGE